ncbi:MAG: ABC transporter substrate-binding protein [Desulfurococcaceae archaeon]|nr:ABC transporter substrate-binding protein [Desulfurococcaceae archaeon]
MRRSGDQLFKILSLIIISLIILGIGSAMSFVSGQQQIVELKIGMPDQIDNFNPLIGTFAAAGFVRGLLYNTLLYVYTNGTYGPWLAESYSIDTQNLTITFKLRPNLKWHDGYPLTSKDVVFTFNLILKSNYSDKLDKWNLRKYISDVYALDDRTVVFKLSQPFAPALFYVSALIPILPEHIWSQVDPTTFKNMDNPIGSGPFKFLRYTPGVSIELVANPDFFLGKPKIDKITIILYKSTDTLMLALQKGDIDAITATTVAPELVPVLIRDPNIRIVTLNGSGSLRWIGFNNDKYPFNIREFREAIAYAVDKEALVNTVMLGYAWPATDGWIQPLFGIWYDPNVTYRPQNFTKANEILDSLGFKPGPDGIRVTPNGTRLSITILTISGVTEFERSAELLAGWLKKIGIDAKVSAQALGTVDQSEGVGDFDIGFMGIGMSITTDVDWYLYERFHSSQAPPIGQYAARNWARYRNPEMDNLLELERTTMDPDARREIVYKIQELIAKDLPVLTLYVKYSMTAYRTDRFVNWNEAEGPTSMISLLQVSPKKPEIITQTEVTTQIMTQTQIIGQTATQVVVQTQVVTQTPSVQTVVQTVSAPVSTPAPSISSDVLIAVIVVVVIIIIGLAVYLMRRK